MDINKILDKANTKDLAGKANTMYGKLEIKFSTKPINIYYVILLFSTKVLAFLHTNNSNQTNIEFMQYS